MRGALASCRAVGLTSIFPAAPAFQIAPLGAGGSYGD